VIDVLVGLTYGATVYAAFAWLWPIHHGKSAAPTTLEQRQPEQRAA
jgi:hypothetical protein